MEYTCGAAPSHTAVEPIICGDVGAEIGVTFRQAGADEPQSLTAVAQTGPPAELPQFTAIVFEFTWVKVAPTGTVQV